MGVFIIAEAGVNHNGSVDLALQMVDAAKAAGADCIKFQTFRTEKLVSKNAVKADYQKENTGDGSQQDMLKKLELTHKDFLQLKAYCDEKEIVFLSTPFDLDSIAFLGEISMPFWKIPSGEVTNYPYLKAIGETGKPVVMSTGMCTLDEIRASIEVLRQFGADDITLLHCNTEYPTPFSDVNLRAMLTLKETFDVAVGYSDHTTGIEIPIAAAALGATVIEKHFTLDRKMDGPDHKASLEPEELRTLVRSVRHVEAALGTGVKTPTESEKKNLPIARKSIVASKAIRKGEVFTENNLTTKRPGTGISPMRWPDIIGRISSRDYDEEDLIEC